MGGINQLSFLCFGGPARKQNEEKHEIYECFDEWSLKGRREQPANKAISKRPTINFLFFTKEKERLICLACWLAVAAAIKIKKYYNCIFSIDNYVLLQYLINVVDYTM